MQDRHADMDRRSFLKTTAVGLAAAGANSALPALASNAEPQAPKAADTTKPLEHRHENPSFVYRRLGRTNYNCGRIVAGWIKDEKVLNKVLELGVNYLDCARGYGNHELTLAKLLKGRRDQFWVTSKATGIAGYNTIDSEVQSLYRKAMAAFLGNEVKVKIPGEDVERTINPTKAKRESFLALHFACVEKMNATGQQPDWRPLGKRISDMYSTMLEESLQRLEMDHVDAYFMHGIEIPWIFQCTELWDTYEKAHKAGKIRHFGFSTHQNQKYVLAAAYEANKNGPWKIDLCMPGINPESFHDVKAELAKLKAQDVGVIAMKTSGKVRRPADKKEEKLAKIFEDRDLNEWERAKTYMLHATDGLIDCCIAAMTNMDEVNRTLSLPHIRLTAATRRKLEAIVKLEMAGSCRHCGHCTVACPEEIAVFDILRYHAYAHEYKDEELAAKLYNDLGFESAKRCTGCGNCTTVCPEPIDLLAAVNEMAAQLT